MEFHIARKARDRYGMDDKLFSYTGNVVFANLAASRVLAQRVNEVRRADNDSPQAFHAASLFAMGLIDELSHALVARYRQTLDPDVFPEALRWFISQLDKPGMEKLLTQFTEHFPSVAVYRGSQTVEEWLEGVSDNIPHREAAFEEMMFLWLANLNPAFAPFREFFDDGELVDETVYESVTAQLDSFFATRPHFDPAFGTLLDVLRAPMLAAPESLTGQLEYIREQWVEHLGEDVRRVLLAIDVVKEEDIAIWMQFHPGSASAQHSRDQQGWRGEGFVGDEFVGFDGEGYIDEQGVRRFRAGLGPDGQPEQPTIHEYEAFSADHAWMPTVVLIAKSTYVWLEQLSKKYGRHIHRLDQIPDEELGVLADRGLNGLWLIGLWERSVASQTIKRMRGQADAVASAYSVADYKIAHDLGGEEAYRVLRDRAAAKGIRLASDMVPNHMGIDSTWVMNHPEWFLSVPQSPFPVYSFEGPDLSNDSRVELKIEDHYFDQTDAAVVFRRREQASGHTDFVYHGNDGTTFAWNDTAQLDYSKAVVREQVMQTILAVARLFPIIRFDAAMTLAKKHVQRLWFPIPGVGGSIPSRAEHAISNAEFDALMPAEFWREVVDRVAVEVPGTLLLAEAFWLLEGYFVRTLGMHRVYNSAFMNMLRDEENAKYRSYLKKTIEFDPDILKRYVNFMSNPDERTAIDQFGSGDRYFGVCTLLATIPGLPMFGHGQIEAFTEKYGMEYKTAKFDEWPNEDLVARHQREIAPLLKNRRLYAESEHFVMYDFWGTDGTVDENVFAYSNRLGDERGIILFNNRYGGTRGTIHVSAESMDKGSGQLRTRRLDDALNLQKGDGRVAAYKDEPSGLWYLRRASDLADNGLTLDLRAYQYVVLQQWRELQSTTEQPWDTLCDALNGGGVYNLEEALSKLRLRPLHEALRQLLSQESVNDLLPSLTAVDDGVLSQAMASAEPIALSMADSNEAEKIQLVSEEPLAQKHEVVSSEPADVPPFDSATQEYIDRVMNFLTTLVRFEGAEVDEVSLVRRLTSSVSALQGTTLPPSPAKPWPPTFAHVLPLAGTSDKPAPSSVWAPVLAWTVLHLLHTSARPAVTFFDGLQLRAATAEIFSSWGYDGESAWRAAARVGVLLRHAGEAQDFASLFRSEAFWSDPDVHWLAGLNRYEGKSFLNRELFEELVAWMALPSLLAGDGKIAQTISDLLAIADRSGYEMEALLVGLEAGAPKDPSILCDADQTDNLDPLPDAVPAYANTMPQRTNLVSAT